MPPKKNKNTRKTKTKQKQKQSQKQNQTVIVNINKTRKPRSSNASKSNKAQPQPIHIPPSQHTFIVERPTYSNPNTINEPIKQDIHNHYYNRADYKEPTVNNSIGSKHFKNNYDYDESYNLDDLSTITSKTNNPIYENETINPGNLSISTSSLLDKTNNSDRQNLENFMMNNEDIVSRIYLNQPRQREDIDNLINKQQQELNKQYNNNQQDATKGKKVVRQTRRRNEDKIRIKNEASIQKKAKRDEEKRIRDEEKRERGLERQRQLKENKDLRMAKAYIKAKDDERKRVIREGKNKLIEKGVNREMMPLFFKYIFDKDEMPTKKELEIKTKSENMEKARTVKANMKNLKTAIDDNKVSVKKNKSTLSGGASVKK
jgi:hypothetical protein